jgi:Tol biopolymer transport system component
MGSHNVQFSPDGSKIIINQGDNGIWTINPDGSEYTCITDTIKSSSRIPSTCIDSTGTVKIAFAGSSEGYHDIYLVNLDGSNLTNLTNSPNVNELYPFLSSDGNKIVFTICTAHDSIRTISVINSDGTDIQEVIRYINNTTFARYYSYPRFNSNGSKIFYQFVGYNADQIEGLYLINSDGTENHLLFDGNISSNFISMPLDCSKIVFIYYGHLYIMNEDGTNLIDLVEVHNGYCQPMISCDGSKIVYDDREIYIINSDGTGLQQLALGDEPTFSPDGEKIVFNGIKEIEVQY